MAERLENERESLEKANERRQRAGDLVFAAGPDRAPDEPAGVFESVPGDWDLLGRAGRSALGGVARSVTSYAGLAVPYGASTVTVDARGSARWRA